jgi:hypothetical protein
MKWFSNQRHENQHHRAELQQVSIQKQQYERCRTVSPSAGKVAFAAAADAAVVVVFASSCSA